MRYFLSGAWKVANLAPAFVFSITGFAVAAVLTVKATMHQANTDRILSHSPELVYDLQRFILAEQLYRHFSYNTIKLYSVK